MSSTETSLVIDGVAIPVGAGRRVTCSVRPIDHGELRRTINGNAVWLGRASHRRWRLELSGSDQLSPTLAALWPGQVVDVEWPAPLREPGNGTTSIELTRDPVAGSVRAWTAAGLPVEVEEVDGRDVTLAAAAAWVEYRPDVEMIVTEQSYDHAERQADETWTIVLEEA